MAYINKIILGLSFLIILLFLFSCAKPILTQPTVVVEPSTELPAEPTAPVVEVAVPPPPPVNLPCTLTADCQDGKQCINGQCRTVEAFYSTDCASKCNFEEVIISTSDGETYTLGKGQGSYTAAGAIEWKLINVPDYCATEPAMVPLKIIAKNYGRIVGEYVLTLQEGETSGQIIHPAIPSIEFTVTVEKVKESCS